MLARTARSGLRRLPGARRAGLMVRFGDVGRTAPLSPWGGTRGLPVDRWYIERYLADNATAVKGRVLEVKLDTYASRFGASAVDVLDIDANNPHATVVGDLCSADTLEPGRYDAAIVTQTLQLVTDPGAAVRQLLLSLRPGGSLLMTVPCLSRIVDGSDRWRWTPVGFKEMISDVAPDGADTRVQGLGNGLAARAFLFGLAAEDLTATGLAQPDDAYPLVVGGCVRVPG